MGIFYNNEEWDTKENSNIINSITGMRLMRCKHCKAAEDSAALFGTKCTHKRHSFTELYISGKDMKKDNNHETI